MVIQSKVHWGEGEGTLQLSWKRGGGTHVERAGGGMKKFKEKRTDSWIKYYTLI